MPLTCRIAEPRDLPGVEQLWREETPWGALGDDRRSWFRQNPCEGSMAVIAVDENERVIGEMIFIAQAVMISGKQYRSVRPLASIVNRSVRGSLMAKPLEHPMMLMYRYGIDVARDRGDAVVYMLPNPKWMPFFRYFPQARHCKFRLWSLPLPLAEPFSLPDGYTAGPLQAWDERVDALWERTARLHGCLAVRDARTLSWKTNQQFYALTAVEHRGELVGLVASLHKDVQWLICDLLSADDGEAMRATLMAVCNFAHDKFQHPDPGRPFRKAAIMVTPKLQAAVESLGFQPDAYNFVFVARSLRPDIMPDEVDPQRWYASAND